MDRAFSQATRTDTHDVGFIIGESFGNGYRLTGDTTYKSEILTDPASLAQRYNPTVGAVRSWSFGPWQYPVIIDNMMTLGPLEWGAKHGGNLSWGVDAATLAQTTITYPVRSNGSTYEMADFNPTTGAFIANYTPLIGPSSAIGAAIPVRRSAPTNVVVFQWPWERRRATARPQGRGLSFAPWWWTPRSRR